MKTLIFILAAALASPALGDGKTTTTETTSTSTTTSSPGSSSGSGSMSGSGTSADATTLESESVDSQDSSLSGSATSDYNSDSSMSGSSTGSDSSMSGTSSDYQSDSSLSGSGSDMGATTTTTPSTTDSSSSLSGAATAPATSAPAAAPSQTTNVIVPPASATAAPAAPPEQASRTYREEEDGGLRPGGFFLEPAVFGSQQENDFSGANAGNVGAPGTTDANGFGLDLKLGGHINESFFLAADARYERATLQDQAFEDTDADVYNWGPVIGFQAPKYGLRAWGTYVVDGVYNPETAANGVDLEFKNPYGWRGGIGVRFEAVSVNLEYEDLTYRTTDVESFGGLANAEAADIDFSQRGASLSLSFPVEL